MTSTIPCAVNVTQQASTVCMKWYVCMPPFVYHDYFNPMGSYDNPQGLNTNGDKVFIADSFSFEVEEQVSFNLRVLQLNFMH